ncbi:MAG: response regulator [Marinoscillum sp.]
MKLRAISIDDDPTSILMVKQLAEKTEGLELVNTYQDAVKGAAGIILDRPDVLFLDIEMPEFNGIEIMQSLVKPPKIIVISGNPSFKNKALEMNAVTFISKPPEEEEFKKAIDKVRDIFNQELANA